MKKEFKPFADKIVSVTKDFEQSVVALMKDNNASFLDVQRTHTNESTLYGYVFDESSLVPIEMEIVAFHRTEHNTLEVLVQHHFDSVVVEWEKDGIEDSLTNEELECSEWHPFFGGNFNGIDSAYGIADLLGEIDFTDKLMW